MWLKFGEDAEESERKKKDVRSFCGEMLGLGAVQFLRKRRLLQVSYFFASISTFLYKVRETKFRRAPLSKVTQKLFLAIQPRRGWEMLKIRGQE